MVNLKFNPKNTNENGIIIKSRVSKNKNENEDRLNPFKTSSLLESCIPGTSGIPSVPGTSGIPGIPGSPQNIQVLIGLDNYNYIIKNWYTQSNSNKSNKFLLLIGPTGCGKTTLVNNFCIENSIETFRTNGEVKSKKDLLKDVIYFTQFSNSFNKYFKKEEQDIPNKLIFIDEYSNSTTDILSISDIQVLFDLRVHAGKENKVLVKEATSLFGLDWNIIQNVKIPPILIISADSKGTRLSELKRNTDVYYINDINKNLIKSWLKSSKQLSNTNDNILDLLINKCNNDIRLLLHNLDFFGKEIHSNLITNFYKDEDVNLFEFINKLFDNIDPIDIDETFKVYDTDGYLLSNLVQENYIDFSDEMDSLANSADSISYGDIVLNDLYDSNKVFTTEIHCIYSMYLPSVFSRSDVKKNKCQLRSSVLNNRYNIYLNNKKIIDKINIEESNLLDIFTILHIKKFINYELIKSKSTNNNQFEYLRSILSLFENNAIEKLETIYKSFHEFKDIPVNKTKTFTIKFKDKLKKLINGNQ